MPVVHILKMLGSRLWRRIENRLRYTWLCENCSYYAQSTHEDLIEEARQTHMNTHI